MRRLSAPTVLERFRRKQETFTNVTDHRFAAEDTIARCKKLKLSWWSDCEVAREFAFRRGTAGYEDPVQSLARDRNGNQWRGTNSSKPCFEWRGAYTKQRRPSNSVKCQWT